MKIIVKAKPRSKEEGVRQLDACTYVVAVKEPAHEGLANEAIRRALAEHFGVPRTDVQILHGHLSKSKIIEIVSDEIVVAR